MIVTREMVVTESVILDAHQHIVFANYAEGTGRERVVFKTPDPVPTGTSVTVVVTY